MESVRGALAAIVIGIATALVVIALAILPFLNPAWVGFEQERSGAAALTGFSPADLRRVTDSILSDLVLGPPDFTVQVGGAPALVERERDHMRDVRRVFGLFYLVAALGALVLCITFLASRGSAARARFWRRVSRSGVVIAIVTVVGGVLGLAVFDAAFEAFHELFFPAGSFDFDPLTDHLVQLFPDQFWVETTIGVGVVVIVLAIVVAGFGRWRAGVLEAKATGTPGTLNAVPIR